MDRPCIAFRMQNRAQQLAHIAPQMVEDYGDRWNGKFLYAWDDGYRFLARCRNCGGLILVQRSDLHSFCADYDDEYYVDYFPVSSREEALELNDKYNGDEIESALRDVAIFTKF